MAKFDLQEQEYDVGNARIALVAARFNHAVVERLLEGAVDTLGCHGIADANIDVHHVPGAFELPLAAQRLAASGRYDAIITLGAVIRGGTPHFEYVAGECARGVAQVALEQHLPVIFGVLTVDTMQQATDRAGGCEGNKGHETALAALEMVTLLRKIKR